MGGISFASSVLISIHALRVEGDVGIICPVTQIKKFLSTPSVWRATSLRASASPAAFNFYPRPPCGGRLRLRLGLARQIGFLSTPSVWRATTLNSASADLQDISIHALRVEGDQVIGPCLIFSMVFLSTPSVWRAT